MTLLGVVVIDWTDIFDIFRGQTGASRAIRASGAQFDRYVVQVGWVNSTTHAHVSSRAILEVTFNQPEVGAILFGRTLQTVGLRHGANLSRISVGAGSTVFRHNSVGGANLAVDAVKVVHL